MAGLVIIIVLAFVFLRGDQINELAETMAQGAVIPLVIAILTQLCKYVSQSFAYTFSFKAVGETMRPKNTLPLVFGTFFLNTVIPSLNLAGTTLVVDDARRRGISAGKATSAALLMQITVDSAFATIMIIGFAILALTVGISPIWLVFGFVVILLVGAMISIMVLGNKNPELVIRILNPISRFVNKVLVRFHKNPLDPWVEKTVHSFSKAAKLLAKNPKTVLKAWGCSLIASCCELSAFCLVGYAFGVAVPESLVCGYVVATLFAMISFTPQGVGVVEAAVTVAFTAFGASATAGMAIGLVYRGIVFWMPFLIGAILIQTTKTFRPKKEKKEKVPDTNFNRQRRREELGIKAAKNKKELDDARSATAVMSALVDDPEGASAEADGESETGKGAEAVSGRDEVEAGPESSSDAQAASAVVPDGQGAAGAGSTDQPAAAATSDSKSTPGAAPDSPGAETETAVESR